MNHAWDIATPLLVAAVVAAVTWAWRLRQRERSRDVKLDRIIEVFEGRPADRIANLPAQPGLVVQLDTIEEQLHRNGGTTLRDAVGRIEVAVDDLRTAQLAAARRAVLIETLLRQHMRDGQTLLKVGQANDDTLWAALRAHGVDIADPIPLPKVVLTIPDDEKAQEE